MHQRLRLDDGAIVKRLLQRIEGQVAAHWFGRTGPLRRVVLRVLEHHPHRALPHFR